MNRLLFPILLLLPLCASGQQATPPDWKAAYEQANESAKKWKAKADDLSAENARLKDRVAILSDKLLDDPVRAAADEQRRKDQLARVQAASSPPIYIVGRVLSVSDGGILVSTEGTSPQVPDKLCFLDTDGSKYLDGQPVNIKAGAMPDPYEYKSVNGARRRVPRFRPVP